MLGAFRGKIMHRITALSISALLLPCGCGSDPFFGFELPASGDAPYAFQGDGAGPDSGDLPGETLRGEAEGQDRTASADPGGEDAPPRRAPTELCDGADNDGDGLIDEDTCEDWEDCTTDFCEGPAGCFHHPLDGGECGGVCIAGGHCVAGICVGQPVMSCHDDDPCTLDACDPAEGCVFTLQVPCGTDPGSCDEGAACGPGETQEETVPCGACGVQVRLRACTEDCQWGPWGAWSACDAQGACSPGDSETGQGACGLCGTQSRSRACTELCQWGEWGPWGACGGEGVCSPGDTQGEETGCGNCGKKSRSRACTDQCQWSAWGDWGSCGGQGVCAPGNASGDGCDPCAQRVCNASCQWGGCGLKPGAQCEWNQGTHWKCCASGKWHFCLGPSYGCIWSPDCVPCTGCGC